MNNIQQVGQGLTSASSEKVIVVTFAGKLCHMVADLGKIIGAPHTGWYSLSYWLHFGKVGPESHAD